MHTYIHTYTRTYIYTYTHTHTVNTQLSVNWSHVTSHIGICTKFLYSVMSHHTRTLKHTHVMSHHITVHDTVLYTVM